MTKQEKIEALRHTLMTRGWLEVIKPSLELAIQGAEMEWLTGRRGTGREKITEDMLRQTIIDMKWMLDWERRTGDLVDQLEAAEELRRQTEPATEGGTPYA